MKGKRPTVFSIASLAFVVLLLTATVYWHGERKQQLPQRTSEFSVQRLLQDVDEEAKGEADNLLDDDQKRSETCKKYLYNFLNGTTDANDQCQGFYNAYQAADCKDDTHNEILGNDQNNTDKDDDVLIDDFFERWSCCDTIQSFYQRNCEESSDLHSSRLLGIMLVMLVCTMIKALLKALNIHWLPDSCAFILVGTFVGLLLRVLDKGLLQKRLSFDNDLFLQIMLPPIIFQAALSIDKRAFRRDLFPILAFAGFGTAFSAVTIGLITHHITNSRFGGNLPLLDSLVFGSLISSIDPVATLSILSGVGVSQTDTLYTLIFGESLLNDGVAIVLFDTLKTHLGEDDVLDQQAYHEIARQFFTVLFGSIGIGLFCGVCCTLFFYILKGRQTAVTEVAIFFCWALIPYYIADGLECSGIISIMTMGFFLDYFVVGGFDSQGMSRMEYSSVRNQEIYVPDNWTILRKSLGSAFSGKGHIHSESRHHVGFVAEVIASLMDTAIFAYLGLFLFTDNAWDVRLNMTAILSVVSSRGVMVLVLSFIVNVFVFFDVESHLKRCFRSFRAINLAEDDISFGNNDRPYLDKKTQLILLLAGVRGAVSFALVENIPVYDTINMTGSKYKSELKGMTSCSIVFTLFVFGALTFITVKRHSDPSQDLSGNQLAHRLLSEPLNNEGDAPSDLASLALETQDRHQSNPTDVPNQYQVPTMA